MGDLLAELPEMIATHVRAAMGMPLDTRNQRFESVLMGRTTYDVGARLGFTSPYRHLRQYVVSTTLTSPDQEVTVLGGDVVDRVRALKDEAGRRHLARRRGPACRHGRRPHRRASS